MDRWVWVWQINRGSCPEREASGCVGSGNKSEPWMTTTPRRKAEDGKADVSSPLLGTRFCRETLMRHSGIIHKF